MREYPDMKSILYTDGGVIKSNPSPFGGTWAYCLVGYRGNHLYEDCDYILANKLPSKRITNNQMELLAVIRGLQTIQRDMVIHICSDSEITLGRVFKNYSMENIPDWMIEQLDDEKKRLHNFKKFKYTLLSGHPTKAQLETGIGRRGHPVSYWNKHVDELCRKAAQDYSSEFNLLDRNTV